jgi:hypothetical protein
MQRLFRAGLTQEQPYFLVEPVARGWYGIQHLPSDHPPQRQAIMVVSEFDPPPIPVDMPLWQRFRRALNTQKAIDPEQWQQIHRMVLSAVRLVARPQRGGRVSAERQAAQRLLTAVEHNESLLMGWAQQEPEVVAEVRDMLVQVTGHEPEEPEVVPFARPQPEAHEDIPEDRPSRRGGRPTRPFPLATFEDEAPADPEPRPPTRRRRRTWPQIPQIEQDDPEDLPPPRPAVSAESEDETEQVAESETDEPIGEGLSRDAPGFQPLDGDYHETQADAVSPTPPEDVPTEDVPTEPFVDEVTETEPVAQAEGSSSDSDEVVTEDSDEVVGEDDTEASADETDEGETEQRETSTTNEDGDLAGPEVAEQREETNAPSDEGEPESDEPEPEREIDLNKVFAKFVEQISEQNPDEPTTEKKTEDDKPAGMGEQPEIK